MSAIEKLILENQVVIMKTLLMTMHPSRAYDELQNKIVETQNKLITV